MVLHWFSSLWRRGYVHWRGAIGRGAVALLENTDTHKQAGSGKTVGGFGCVVWPFQLTVLLCGVVKSLWKVVI